MAKALVDRTPVWRRLAAPILLAMVLAGCSAGADAEPAAGVDPEPTNTTAPAADTTAPTTEAPAPADTVPVIGTGDGYTYEDGLQVSIPSIERFTPSEFAAGHTKGNMGVLLAIKITNGTTSPADVSLTTVDLAAGEDGMIAEQVFDTDLGAGFTGMIAPGKSATAKFGFSVEPGTKTVDVTVSPGFLDYDPALFTGTLP